MPRLATYRYRPLALLSDVGIQRRGDGTGEGHAIPTLSYSRRPRRAAREVLPAECSRTRPARADDRVLFGPLGADLDYFAAAIKFQMSSRVVFVSRSQILSGALSADERQGRAEDDLASSLLIFSPSTRSSTLEAALRGT